MTSVTYPSQDFPAPLPIAVEIPDEWMAIHVPYMLMSARAVTGHDGFHPNVTVGWQRVALEVDPQEFLDQAARVGATSYVNYRLVETKVGESDDVTVAASRQRFDSGEGTPAFQETLYVFGPPTTERSRDLFQITATRHEEDVASGEMLTRILNSFTILDLTAEPDAASDSETG